MILKAEIDYSPLLSELEKNNLTDAKIYKLWGIQRKTLYNIKHGNGITVDTLAKLGYILETPINELVNIKITEIESE